MAGAPGDDPNAAAKERAGRHAADLVADGMRVGLGTGSTAHFAITALGERAPAIVCVATSRASERLATGLGLDVVPPGTVDRLDLAIDGADEIDGALNLIKGGGGAHTREKIVASMADRFVVVADEGKLVERLTGRVPIEVVEFGADVVTRRLAALGASTVERRPDPSDNGNPILDAWFGPIEDPPAFGRELGAIPGVVEHGIFPAVMVERVVVGRADGVRELVR